MRKAILMTAVLAACLSIAAVAADTLDAASRERYGSRYYFSAEIESVPRSAGERVLRRRIYVSYFHRPLVLYLEPDRGSKATVEIAIADIARITLYHGGAGFEGLSGGAFISARVTTDGGADLDGYVPADKGLTAVRKGDLGYSAPLAIAIKMSQVSLVEFSTKKGDAKDSHDYAARMKEALKKISKGGKENGADDDDGREKSLDARLDEIERTMDRSPRARVRKHLRKLEKETGSYYRIDYLLARTYLRVNDAPKAKKLADKAIAAQPDYAPALFLRLRIIYFAGDFSKAVDEANILLKLAPPEKIKLDTLYVASQSYYRTSKLAMANLMAKRMLEIREDARAYAMLGLIQVIFKNWNNARNRFTKALATVKAQKDESFDRSSIYLNLGSLDEIDALDCEKKVEILKDAGDYESAEAYYIKARAKYRSAAENYSSAIRANYFQKAAELKLSRLEEEGKVKPRKTKD